MAHGGHKGAQAAGTQSVNVGPMLTVGVMLPIVFAVWEAWRTRAGKIIIGLLMYGGCCFVSPILYFIVPIIAVTIWYRLIRVPGPRER